MMPDNAKAIRITPLQEAERAHEYPYQAPASSYVMDGESYVITDSFTQDELGGRIAVLSVGSNRAPQQLLRKYQGQARLPVTRALLKDCDIIHSACFSYYGAVPCSAYPCIGTNIMLNAVWLTPAELQIMHDTEAVGIAYDYCRWDEGAVEIFDAPQPEAIYGYATRLGFLADEAGKPFGLSALPAQNRQFTNLDQAQARAALYQRLPETLRCADEEAFLARLVADKAYRLEVNDYLSQMAPTLAQGPWQIIPATPTDAERFL